jgi:hypothetical protein
MMKVKSLPLLLLAAIAAFAQHKVPVTTFTFPGGHEEDGFWTSILAASDGRVYVGLCGHGGSARMYVYEPKMQEIRHLASMQQAAHEEHQGREPQGKLHSQILEDAQGRVWWGSDMANHTYFAMWDDPRSYPGGHMFRYDPKKDLLADLGIPFPGAGIRHIAMDQARQRIYAVTFPRGEFWVYDMQSLTARFQGRVNNWDSIARVMVLDDKGNVYGSFAPYRIFKYDISSERLVDLPVTIPHIEGPWCDRGHGHRENIWRNAVWDSKDQAVYALETGSATLFRFHPSTNAIKDLGQLVVSEFKGSRIVPYSSHGFALHPNRKLYYTAPLSRFDSPVHLLSYDTASGNLVDLGEMADSRGFHPVDLQGASVGPDRTIWFAGWVKPPGVRTGSRREGTVMGLVALKAADLK